MRHARTELSLSQSFVAHNLGISQGQYSKLENGKARLSLMDWIEFCRLLGLDYNSIFYGHPTELLKKNAEKFEILNSRFPNYPNVASNLTKSVSH